MIFATSKPIQEYVVDTGDIEVGIYTAYQHDPALLAFIMIATLTGYEYEQRSNSGKAIVEVENIKVFEECLSFEIKGKTVKELLSTLTPLEFYEFIIHEDLTALPLVRDFLDGNDHPLKVVVGARAAVWALNFRGTLESLGNVTKVSFGGLEVPENLQVYDEQLRRNMGYV